VLGAGFRSEKERGLLKHSGKGGIVWSRKVRGSNGKGGHQTGQGNEPPQIAAMLHYHRKENASNCGYCCEAEGKGEKRAEVELVLSDRE